MPNSFTLSAFIVCYDIRVSTHVSTVVDIERKPTEDEAKQLLYPVADDYLRKNYGDAYQYELLNLTIR
ncbi:hypothetical protein GCM10028805_50420 [Spirosoma harenae]